jgi:hypothetical protein
VLREYPLLKVGLVMMAFALALTGATVAVMLLLRDKPAAIGRSPRKRRSKPPASLAATSCRPQR